MPINILMPALSPTMEKGNLAKWLKKEGDKVKTGDILAEIETDKATMEYEAVDDGTLAKILVPEGSADIAVNQPIAILATEGEDVKAAAGGGAPAKAAPATATPLAAAPAGPGGSPAPTASPAAKAPAASPAAPAPAAAKPAPAPAASPASSPAPAANGHGRIFASPLARRLAKTAGIDIGRIPGTGPHGRIIARDVEAAKSGGTALRAPSPAAAAGGVAPAPVQAPSDDKIRALFEPGSYEVVPHDNIRKIIAQRLVLAKQTIPHFYLTVTCTIDKLLAAREETNASAPKGADDKLGMYGIEEFAAVINPPHATILAVGAGEQRAVVRDGKLAIATQMKVTLSTDHRAVDGALGAELIGAFRTYIESPVAMLV